MRCRRLIFLALVVVSLSIPVVAFARATSLVLAEETTETTAATTETAPLVYETPAISIPPVVEEETEAPWTTKFLIPTSLGLAVIVVFVTSVQYFQKVVKTRYKVVE